MYNEDIKKRFVEDYSSAKSSQAACVRLFNATEPFEREWNADICTRPTEDIQTMLDSVAGLTVDSRYAQVAILKKYGKWCLTCRIPKASDGILGISHFIGGLDAIRLEMVANPVQLQEFLDCVFSPEEMENYDNIYRVYCWLHFMGIPKDMVMSVDSDLLDFEELTLSVNGQKYEIYSESIPAFRKAAELTYFTYNRNGRLLPNRRIPGSNIMRGIRSIPSEKTIWNRISFKNQLASERNSKVKNLSCSRIRQSGIFFRMLQRETRGFSVDFTEVAIDGMREKECTDEAHRSTYEKTLYKYIWRYKTEYERWKLAFSL